VVNTNTYKARQIQHTMCQWVACYHE
jgi:hypothetical protein